MEKWKKTLEYFEFLQIPFFKCENVRCVILKGLGGVVGVAQISHKTCSQNISINCVLIRKINIASVNVLIITPISGSGKGVAISQLSLIWWITQLV